MAYLEITGTITGIRWEGKIVIVQETYEDTFKNETQVRKRLWTCWFNTAPTVKEQETVTIGGDLSTKIGSWEKKLENGAIDTRQIVEHHLRSATLRETSVDDLALPF